MGCFIKTFLYLLVFSCQNAFKIGKANDLHVRIDSLRRSWGEVDYDSSYFIEVEKHSIFTLEKALHLLLENRSMRFNDGDGKTEFFELDALPIALGYLNLYLSDKYNDVGLLTKGVKKINQERRSQKRKHNKYKRLKSDLVNSYHKLNNCNLVYFKIRRLILFLYCRRHIIPYEYEIVNDVLFFRTTKIEAFEMESVDYIMDLFVFRMECLSASFCTAKSDGEVVQYTIRLIDLDNNAYLIYMRDKLKSALNILPARSPAVITKIPKI